MPLLIIFCSFALSLGESVSIQERSSWAPHALKYPTKSYHSAPIKHFLNTPNENQSKYSTVSFCKFDFYFHNMERSSTFIFTYYIHMQRWLRVSPYYNFGRLLPKNRTSLRKFSPFINNAFFITHSRIICHLL